jgi:biotin carboxylase
MTAITILCLASYEKGAEFLRECHRQGCRVLLITVEKLAHAAWPRDAVDGFWRMPDQHTRLDLIHAVSWLARTERIDRIVALDEFDLEAAAALREHLRVRGLGESETRRYRDKLVMREGARASGVLVPAFTGIFQDQEVHAFCHGTPGPWVLKPRTEASAVGIRKLHTEDEVIAALDALGDRRSFHLLERYIPGDVYHVDSVVADGVVLFAEAHRYARPPFDVMHGGGVFCSRTLPRETEETAALLAANANVAGALEFRRGVLHTEFIRSDDDGAFYFLETAARVGGANIAELVEAATGINLWREWARLEVAAARGEPYQLPPFQARYAGVLISLARQEQPDTSAYADPEIVWRLDKRHHAGLIVASADARRVQQLLDQYMERFRTDFFATLPAPDRPTA